MIRRSLIAAAASITVLGLVLAVAALPVFFTQVTTHASKAFDGSATTIKALSRISIVGSTAFILDAHGKTIAVDANPYGVTITPSSIPVSTVPGTLQDDDIVVSNIGANDTGTTLVRFPKKMGPGHLFNTVPNPGTKGPSAEAFNPLSGNMWVANVSGNDVQVFRPNGTILTTITSPLFNKPWGQTSNHGMRNPQDGAVGSFFSTNVADGTIDRIDIVLTNGNTAFKVYQIGQLGQLGQETKIAVTWVPSLRLNGKMFSDVLLATDPVMNRIVIYDHSSTRNTSSTRSTDKGITAFQGLPLNKPAGFTFNPLNGDLLVANQNDNNLVELNLSRRQVVAIRLLDNVPVDNQSGNGSALFGVLATTDEKGNLEVFFTDDNTNTLDVLSMS
jgi:hypothetical protein